MEEIKSKQPVLVGLGEVLWDLLPTGPQVGGAPANFAYYAAALGNRSLVASRIGTDELGQATVQQLAWRAVETTCLQLDETRPTGTVQVQLDAEGQPDYIITEQVAWDFLAWTPAWQRLAAQADAVCFGSLAQRSPAARATIQQFLHATSAACLRVFDVNLRQNFYSAEILAASLKMAQVVKLNDLELPEVMKRLELAPGDEDQSAQALLQAYDLSLVCVTRGARGSLLVTKDEVVETPALAITVADTIGAGDAFTAALTHYYLRQTPLSLIGQAANRLGAWVATQTGATPPVDQAMLKRLIESDLGAS